MLKILKKLFFVVAGLYSWFIALPVVRDSIQPIYNAGNVQLSWTYFFLTIMCLAFGIACFAVAVGKRKD